MRRSRSTSTPTSPGVALTEAQRYGTLELAKIENMRTQAEDLAAGRKAQSTDDLDAEDGHGVHAAPQQPQGQRWPSSEKKYGFLAVCAGDGLAAVFAGPRRGRHRLRRADHEPLHREHS